MSANLKYHWTQINNDINGNSRHVVSWWNCTPKSWTDKPSLNTYDSIVALMARIGGKRYHNKSYGGGIVFTEYRGCLDQLEARIESLKNLADDRYRILSIDALADGNDNWQWNECYHIKSIDGLDLEYLESNHKLCNRRIMAMLRNRFGINASAKYHYIDDDGINYVICSKRNHRPLYAIEYIG